ncbi:ribonuclease P protein component [Thermodesulfobacteriota bacterium]
MGSYSFPKSVRLLNRKDFVNLNRRGKRCYTPHFTVIYQRNDLGASRLGVTVGRKIGNAVKRNKVKRLVREIFRLHQSRLPQSYDIQIVAKMGADGLDFRTVKEELGEFFSDKEFRS